MAPPAPDILALHAAARPAKAAVIDDRPGRPPASWSFAELNAEANRLGNALHGLGVRPGETVVWCGMNSPGVVRMMHAARKAGVTSVPLNYRLTAEEAAYIVADCGAAAVYADAEFAERFAQVRGAAPRLRQVILFGLEGAAAPAGMVDGDALVAAAPDTPPSLTGGAASDETMIYTSGTTGRPKGAVRSGTGSPEQLRRMVEHIGYLPDDVYLTTGPLYHSGPGGFAAIAHLLGNTIVLQRRFDPEDWLRLVETYRVTTTFSAPTPVRLVCQLPDEVKRRYDVTSLARTIANAAPWSFALKEMYLRDFPEDSLFEVYGSTELGVDTILRPEDQRRKPGSCGRPAPGVELALFDESGQQIEAPHVPGELYVKSPSVFKTYHNAQEKYEKGRRGDWLTVGDVAYRDEEGFYYICDRKNDMIISGGMNVYPAEIEAALDRHPQVLDVAVIGIPSEQWGESVHAVIVRGDAALDEPALLAWAREHLAGYKLPRSVSFVEEIPRNASGKILKKALREPFWKDAGRGVA
ncbi:MAG: AMP-binding protein [Deltaproteobacteria bacterium]|nr:AMP-binding protein [Deltaproteobacteria bacterium]